jgi:hypothetical protein
MNSQYISESLNTKVSTFLQLNLEHVHYTSTRACTLSLDEVYKRNSVKLSLCLLNVLNTVPSKSACKIR